MDVSQPSPMHSALRSTASSTSSANHPYPSTLSGQEEKTAEAKAKKAADTEVAEKKKATAAEASTAAEVKTAEAKAKKAADAKVAETRKASAAETAAAAQKANDAEAKKAAATEAAAAKKAAPKGAKAKAAAEADKKAAANSKAAAEAQAAAESKAAVEAKAKAARLCLGCLPPPPHPTPYFLPLCKISPPRPQRLQLSSFVLGERLSLLLNCRY